MTSRRTASGVAVGVTLLLLLSTAYAACSSGRYGADCSCTSDLSSALGGGTTNFVCADRTWTADGPVVINKVVDLMYDHLFVDYSGVDNAISVPAYGNLTMHVWEYTDGSLLQANFTTNGTFESDNGTVYVAFDNQEQASWSIQLGTYNALVGAVKVSAGVNTTQTKCRSSTAPTQVFFDQEARYTYNVTNTRTKCGFAKGSRDWAMWIWCAFAGLALLLIIFTIVSCCVHPLKKKIWYPPM